MTDDINLSEDFITKAYLQEIQRLSRRAQTQGFSAYLEPTNESNSAAYKIAQTKGKTQLRPNERFLRNTIANVEHANRRMQEKDMWERRKAQRAREADQPVEPERHTNPLEEGLLHAEDHLHKEKVHNSDDELKSLLSRRTGRGRGRTGSRASAPVESSPSDRQRGEEFTTRAMAECKLDRRKKSERHKKERHKKEKKEAKRKREKRSSSRSRSRSRERWRGGKI